MNNFQNNIIIATFAITTLSFSTPSLGSNDFLVDMEDVDINIIFPLIKEEERERNQTPNNDQEATSNFEIPKKIGLKRVKECTDIAKMMSLQTDYDPST